MKFFVVLICLGLEKFFPIETLLHREQTFKFYLRKVSTLSPEEWHQSYYELFVFLLPLEFFICTVHFIGTYYFSNFSIFLLESLIVIYCLGPLEIYHLTPPIPQHVFEKAYAGLFCGLFWFVLLGPFGIILYRLLEYLAVLSDDAPDVSMTPYTKDMIKPIVGYLNWLPVRLFSGVQSAVGKFPKACHYWLDYLLTGWEFNDQLLAENGRVALDMPKDATLESEQYIQILHLIDRTLAVFLVVLTVRTLVHWVT